MRRAQAAALTAGTFVAKTAGHAAMRLTDTRRAPGTAAGLAIVTSRPPDGEAFAQGVEHDLAQVFEQAEAARCDQGFETRHHFVVIHRRADVVAAPGRGAVDAQGQIHKQGLARGQFVRVDADRCFKRPSRRIHAGSSAPSQTAFSTGASQS